MSRASDARVILLFDGAELVGVGGHHLANENGVRYRYLRGYAIALHMRGKVLSDGIKSSDALMNILLSDARGQSGELPVLAHVHQDNSRCLSFMKRRQCIVSPEVEDDLLLVLLT